MADGGAYGIAALVIGGVFSMGVAAISRPRGESEPDLTTIAGLADELVKQRRRNEARDLRIDGLEAEQRQDRARLGAYGRYMAVLQEALRRHGLPVPDPDPVDEPLIRG